MAAFFAIILAAFTPPAIPKLPTRVSHAPVLVSLTRYREAGATVRKLVIHRNGYVTIDDPSGGAGRRISSARMKPSQLRVIRRTVKATPWTHLAKRTTSLPEVDPVAYFFLGHAGRERIVHADRLSTSLKPVVHQLNAILDSGEITLNSRFFAAS